MPKKLSLNDAIKIAESRDGKCLSVEYKNITSSLIWCCSKNHIWNASLNSIKNQRSWCPYCGGSARLTLDDAKQIALSRHGHCLSEKYINNRLPLLWRCIVGHLWHATLSNVKKGKWCPHCAGNARLALEDAKKIAFNRNGQCLSEKYVNSQSPLLWCCNKGHTWFAKLNHIKDGKAWCPYCSKYARENLCREIISKYLGPPSKIRRPDFLKTLKHPRGLELDIPYYDYGFAIEIHGPQHEKYHKFFHKGDPNNFINQQERDQLKNELCEENWIVLRYVWYYEDSYIVIPEHLRELGLIEQT